MNKANTGLISALKNTIIGLVLLVPFSTFVVSSSLYFPYITGKGFTARAIIILIAVLYTVLVVRDRSYLPKKNAVLISAYSFIFVLFLATVFAVDPVRSFWSNQERMEGFVTLLEIFVLFFVSFGVFAREFYNIAKSKQAHLSAPSDFGPWKWFYNVMLLISVILGVYSLTQKQNDADRIFGTLGNSSYLGGYALTHFFIAFYLGVSIFKNKIIQHYKSIKNTFTKQINSLALVILYAIIALFNLFVMYHTGTRGAFAGLLVGFTVVAIIWTLFSKKEKFFRWFGVVILVIMILSVTTLGLTKNTTFVKEKPLLNRFAELITLDVFKVLKEQGYSRSLLWNMSWQGVKENPVLGWGQDNFPYVFAKHYDSGMYAQEQWFDRTHNVFFDWLIASGFLGLIAYLSLFISALCVLWRRTGDNWSVAERAVLTGVILAYFVHNLFVFDNLISYIFFFTLLAFIATRGYANFNLESKPILKEGGRYTVDAIAIVLGIYFIWVSVLSPLDASAGIIKAMSGKELGAKGQVVDIPLQKRFDYMKDAIESGGVTKLEATERLVDLSVELISKTAKENPSFAQSVYSYTVNTYKKQMEATPLDPRIFYFYSIFQNKIGDINGAIESTQKAIDLSPNKQSFWYNKGQLLINANKRTEAVEVFKKALSLFDKNPDALKYYVNGLIVNGNLNNAEIAVSDFAKLNSGFSPDTLWEDAMVIQSLVDMKYFDKAIAVVQNKINKSPGDVQSIVSLSAIYLKQGNRWAAIEELKKIKVIKPEYTATVDKYIKDIQDGKDPTNSK